MIHETTKKKLLFDPDEDRSVYSCLGCNAGLFHAGEKSESGVGFFTFNKPIDASRLQCKKQPDAGGEREMRCAICRRNIGRLLPTGKYRADASALNYVKASTGEIETDPAAPAPIAMNPPPRSFRAQLIGAGVLGVALGAVGGFLICRTTGALPQDLTFTASVATSTEEVLSATSSSPAENFDATVPGPPEILQSGDAGVGTQ